MIPPRISGDTKSPGELILFPKFELDEQTRSWIVLHSLNIANHVRNLEGEADFVVVVPGHGIAVIEVKAVQSIERQDGLWYLGRQQPTTRSPFDQASEAHRSIERALRAQKIDISGVPIDSFVWFTHISRSHHIVDSPEWQPWEALYSEDRRQSVVKSREVV
ncbi:hypothetical protein GCM10009596_21180 [Arthrobacter rhombi]